MKIYSELNKNPNLSLALGFFDGVHLGHKAVIQNAINYAKKHNTKSAVITFKDHPCCFLWNVKPKYILTRQTRQKKIEELGVDFLYELDFESISGLTAEDYLKSVLIDHFTPCAISTGWNHNFGYKKSGDTKFLKDNSKKFGYEYFETQPIRQNLPPHPYLTHGCNAHSSQTTTPFPTEKCCRGGEIKENGEIISSTAIRKYLQAGKIENANEMLGYSFSITGKVVEGNQIGRTIGFKTANIEYPQELIELPYGVYKIEVKKAVWQESSYTTENLEEQRAGGQEGRLFNDSSLSEILQEPQNKTDFSTLQLFNYSTDNSLPSYLLTLQPSETLIGIANYGIRPTINGNKPILEVHILDFDEDIYGETITVEFSRMLRPERKFKSLDELKEQIKKDVSSI